jgi:hypothetical protein
MRGLIIYCFYIVSVWFVFWSRGQAWPSLSLAPIASLSLSGYESLALACLAFAPGVHRRVRSLPHLPTSCSTSLFFLFFFSLFLSARSRLPISKRTKKNKTCCCWRLSDYIKFSTYKRSFLIIYLIYFFFYIIYRKCFIVTFFLLVERKKKREFKTHLWC